jgi:hypothetical protein
MNIKLLDSEYLNFVEFNITGDNDDFNRCDQESLYLDTEVFNIFQNCFENANRTFDYFGGTKYNSRTIIVLRNELNTCLEQFRNITSLNEFTVFIESRFTGNAFLSALHKDDPGWKSRWNLCLKLITGALEDLIALSEKCAFEERVLWVIGY